MRSVTSLPNHATTMAPVGVVVNVMSSDKTDLPTGFKFLFLAVLRHDQQDQPHRIEVVADSYQAARMKVAPDFIALFAGQIPVTGLCGD